MTIKHTQLEHYHRQADALLAKREIAWQTAKVLGMSTFEYPSQRASVDIEQAAHLYGIPVQKIGMDKYKTGAIEF